MYNYRTRGTCSREVRFEVQGGIISKVQFVGGCAGNTQGVSRLAVGRTIEEVIDTLRGIQCRNGTSCPDQLAQALEAYQEGLLD